MHFDKRHRGRIYDFEFLDPTMSSFLFQIVKEFPHLSDVDVNIGIQFQPSDCKINITWVNSERAGLRSVLLYTNRNYHSIEVFRLIRLLLLFKDFFDDLFKNQNHWFTLFPDRVKLPFEILDSLAHLCTDHFMEFIIVFGMDIVLFVLNFLFVFREWTLSFFHVIHHRNNWPPSLIKVRLVLDSLMTIQRALNELDKFFSHKLPVRPFSWMVTKIVEECYRSLLDFIECWVLLIGLKLDILLFTRSFSFLLWFLFLCWSWR